VAATLQPRAPQGSRSRLTYVYFALLLQFSIKSRKYTPLCRSSHCDITQWQCSCSAGFRSLGYLSPPEMLELFGSDMPGRYFEGVRDSEQTLIPVTVSKRPKMKGIDAYFSCMTRFLDPSHNTCGNYSTSRSRHTANMALPCTALYKAKHLRMPLLSSRIALHVLEMNVQHVKSCAQTQSNCVCFIRSFA